MITMIPRMRTAKGVLEEIKRQDPNSEVTLHYIRAMIHTGKFNVVLIGKKKLVNVNEVLELLASGTQSAVVADVSSGIRRVRA